MFKLIKQLFFLLSRKQRFRFYVLQVLVVAMAIIEILGVASIIPFMTLVGDMKQLEQDTIMAQIYLSSGLASISQFVFLLGFGVLVMLFISAMISMLTVWRLSLFGIKSVLKLLIDYILTILNGMDVSRKWKRAQLTKCFVEPDRVTSGIILPILQ